MRQSVPHRARKFDHERNLPEGYIEHNGTRLAYDTRMSQWVWPGGKRISSQAEAQSNAVYLDKLRTGESKCVFNKSGYIAHDTI